MQVKAKDLPKGVDKNDLVVAFRVNAQEEKKNDKETRFKAKYLAPILIPLVLLGAVKGCQSSEPVPVHGERENLKMEAKNLLLLKINSDNGIEI